MSFGISAFDSVWRFTLPYHFEKVEFEGLKHVYIPLNRNYKPLGWFKSPHGTDWVEYQDFPHLFVRFGKDPETFKDIWWGSGPPLYLYADSKASRVTYFERLERLTKLGKLAIAQPN